VHPSPPPPSPPPPSLPPPSPPPPSLPPPSPPPPSLPPPSPPPPSRPPPSPPPASPPPPSPPPPSPPPPSPPPPSPPPPRRRLPRRRPRRRPRRLHPRCSLPSSSPPPSQPPSQPPWPPPSLLPLALAAGCLDADACRDAEAEAGACIVCCACRGEGVRGFASSPNSASTLHPFLQLHPSGSACAWSDGHVAAPRGAPARAARAHRTFPNHDEIFRRIQLAHGVRSHPKHAL
jgi:hypothetical protein